MVSTNKPYGFIYETVLPDGRFYRGQHKIISHRTLDLKYFGSGVIIKDYIKSKGREGIIREILAFGYSRTEMNKLEAYYIPEELLADPLNINLDKGGRHKHTRYKKVKNKISKSMKKVRAERKDQWGAVRGADNNRAKQWKLISPQGEEYLINGALNQFCNEHNLSANTLKVAIKQGWIPKRGSCAGWQAFDLTTGNGTFRDTLNQGDARKGVNNPSHKAKIKRKEKLNVS
jgi:hypothetical protein